MVARIELVKVQCGGPIELVEVTVDMVLVRDRRAGDSPRASYGAAAVLGPRHELAVHAARAELRYCVRGTTRSEPF